MFTILVIRIMHNVVETVNMSAAAPKNKKIGEENMLMSFLLTFASALVFWFWLLSQGCLF